MATLSRDAVKMVLSQNTEQLRSYANVTEVEYISSAIDYEEFFARFLIPNRPCVFGPHVTREWRAVNEWVTENGRPNFDFLASKFGHAVVPVADCKRVEYSAQPKTDMLFAQYLRYWEQLSKDVDEKDKSCLYLKDWHFNKLFPDYKAYETPVFFTSDWMNEYWDKKPDQTSDDYRFVYMGPKGSWTPFHADVFRSYSWSANVCGRKRWLLFPPGQENHLRDTLGNLAYDVTSPELRDPNKYPNYHKACKPFEVIQAPGEVIFVPSGWHHQVFNIEDTISINHNWLNGCNVDITWAFLQQELALVKRSISDCRDMEGWDLQCQMIMKANTGIDYPEFLQLLWTVAEPRLAQVRTYNETRWKSSNSHTNEHDDPQDCTKSSEKLCGQSTTVEPGISDGSIGTTVSGETLKSSNEDSKKTQDTLEKELNSSHNDLRTVQSNSGPAAPTLTDLDHVACTDSVNQIQHLSLCSKEDNGKPSSVVCVAQNSASPIHSGKFNVWHSIFDLCRIRYILALLLEDEDFCHIEFATLCKDPQQLMKEIVSATEGLV